MGGIQECPATRGIAFSGASEAKPRFALADHGPGVPNNKVIRTQSSQDVAIEPDGEWDSSTRVADCHRRTALLAAAAMSGFGRQRVRQRTETLWVVWPTDILYRIVEEPSWNTVCQSCPARKTPWRPTCR